MRRPALLTAAALGALVTAALVTQPGVATAADTTPETGSVGTSRTDWVTAADLTQYTTGAFPTGWFWDGPTAPAFDVDGATLTAPGILAHSATGSAATELTDVQSSAAALGGIDAENLIATGDAHYALAIDLGGSADNTDLTLLTSTATTADAVDGTWVSSVPVGTITPGTAASLEDFQAQFADAAPDATINAFGVEAVDDSATVAGISWQGDSTYFLPKADGTLGVPEGLTPTTLRTVGVHVDASGFLPGETIRASVILPDLETPPADQTFTVAEDGTFSGTTTVSATLSPGDYVLLYEGTTSGVGISFPLVLAAAPAAAPAPAPGPAAAPVATPVTGTATFTG